MSKPGPGQYNENYTTRYKSFGTAVIGRANRLTNLSQNSKCINNSPFNIIFIVAPGPGTYRVQSEFGYYDPADTLANNGVRLKGVLSRSVSRWDLYILQALIIILFNFIIYNII